MRRLLALLEVRFGRWAIPNLTLYIVTANAVVWVMEMLRPGFSSLLLLDLERVREGEVWRLFSFLFIPPTMSPVWIFIMLYFTWLIGSQIEALWGSFKFNVYYLLGMLGTMAAAYIRGDSMSNYHLNVSLLFAFATLFPNQVIILVILPVRAKWLGLLTLLYVASEFTQGSAGVRTAIVIALGNYLLFFYRALIELFRKGAVRAQSVSRRRAFAPPPRQVRRCKICGLSDEDPQADIRVCTCAKCGQPTDYCLEHARNH